MKQVAFIVGPFRSDNRWTEIQNVWRASVVSAHYWRKGYAVICPHSMTSSIVGCVTEEKFMAGLRELVNLLRPGRDVMVVIPGWSDSLGTKAELKLANSHNIRITEVCFSSKSFGKEITVPIVRERKELSPELTEFLDKQ